MTNIIKESTPIIITLLLVQLLAVFVMSPALLQDKEIQESMSKSYENPTEISSILPLIIDIFIFTIIALICIKLGIGDIVKIVLLLAVYLGTSQAIDIITQPLTCFHAEIGIIIGAILTFLTYFYPKWYIIDTTGILVCSVVSGMLGSYLSITPIIALLVILLIYDLYAVFISKHMVELGMYATEKNLPVMFVYPKDEGYSAMGYGDAVFPTLLVVSAYIFSGFWLPVVGGASIGAVVLSYFMMRGKPLPGLPFLNSGAIVGFVAGYLLR